MTNAAQVHVQVRIAGSACKIEHRMTLQCRKKCVEHALEQYKCAPNKQQLLAEKFLLLAHGWHVALADAVKQSTIS